MLVVLDANVIVSGLAAYRLYGTSPDHILRRWNDRAFTICLSEALLAEVKRTLDKQYFHERIPQRRRTDFIASLRRESQMVTLTSSVSGVATHPEDDLILATAVSAHAAFLVTGDRQLLKLGAYEGVKIISPADFIAVLDQGAGSV